MKKSMIIKSTKNIPYQKFGVKPTPGKVSNGADRQEDSSKTASVKFMLTKQDVIDLSNLGYSQEQIDKIKPQEAMDIIQAGIRAGTANGDEGK